MNSLPEYVTTLSIEKGFDHTRIAVWWFTFSIKMCKDFSLALCPALTSIGMILLSI